MVFLVAPKIYRRLPFFIPCDFDIVKADCIAITGGRDWGQLYRHKLWIEDALRIIYNHYQFSRIVLGGAIGVDIVAERWARQHALINKMVLRPDYKRFGNSAPLIRNTDMLCMGCPDLVVAFPGARGTDNMCRQTLRREIPLLDLRFDDTVFYYPFNGKEMVSYELAA